MPKTKTLTPAEVVHVRDVLEEFEYWIKQYPETVDDSIEDKLAVAKEIMYNDSN